MCGLQFLACGTLILAFCFSVLILISFFVLNLAHLLVVLVIFGVWSFLTAILSFHSTASAFSLFSVAVYDCWGSMRDY